MGLGTELPLLVAFGFVVLGPKRMQAVLGHVARAKAELHKASRGIKSQLPGEIKGPLQAGRNDDETPIVARHREDVHEKTRSFTPTVRIRPVEDGTHST